MGKPAAKMGCYHSCPAYDGDTPHVGGPVLSGSGNVFFNGLGACRAGDTLQCNSSRPDQLQSGSTTVFINGQPAGRMGDPTAHGGTLTEGSGTITIG